MAEKKISDEIKSTVAKIVRELKKAGGLQEVYLVACGGSLFELNTPARVNPNALVITMSLSGGTAEVVAAEKKAHELGATVLAIVGKAQCPVAENADYHFVFDNEAAGGDIDYERSNIAIALRIGFELLNDIDKYANYDLADNFIYTIGSGSSYGLARALSVCIFMEMEWINSSAIHAGELFHGPFECVNFDMPYVVMMSEGKNRVLDERALKFVRDQSGRVTVIDARELGVSIIPPQVEEYFSGLYNWIAAMEYAREIAFAKNHPLFDRRYMGKITY